MAGLFLICVAALTAVPVHGQPDLTRWILEAPLIVRGTVVGADSPTLSQVLVRDTLRGAETIGSFTGQQIVVGRTARAERKEGVFFLRPISYGKTLVAEAIGEIDPPGDERAFAAQIARVHQQDAEEKLAARFRSAEVAIVGQVLTVRPVREATRVVPSEHDPEWAIAQVLVVRTLNGQPKADGCGQGRCVEVAFAQSDDIRWFRAPKLRTGQQNIFLLRPPDPKVLRDGELPPAPYALLDPNDLRPLTDEPHLRASSGGKQ